MTNKIQYTERDNVLYNNRIVEGISKVIRYGGPIVSGLTAFGYYALDKTPKDFTPAEGRTYAGILAAGAVIYGVGKLISKTNEKRTLRKLDNLKE